MKKIVDMKTLEPTIREIIAAGGAVRLTVTGQSMLPTLVEKRDSVILTKPGKLKKSDIILYQRTNGDYVLHRIVRVKKGGFALCGDNQTLPEFPIMPEQVIAVVSAIVRKGKIIEKNNITYKFSAMIWTNFISLRPFMLRVVTKIKTRLK